MGSTEETPDLNGLVGQLLTEIQGLRRQVVAANRKIEHLTEAVHRRAEADALARPDPGREGRLYDAKSLAERWGVSERTIDNEVASGAVVPTYIRGARRFTPDAVEAYERTNSGLRRRRKAERRRAAKKAASDRQPIEGRPEKMPGIGDV